MALPLLAMLAGSGGAGAAGAGMAGAGAAGVGAAGAAGSVSPMLAGAAAAPAVGQGVMANAPGAMASNTVLPRAMGMTPTQAQFHHGGAMAQGGANTSPIEGLQQWMQNEKTQALMKRVGQGADRGLNALSNQGALNTRYPGRGNPGNFQPNFNPGLSRIGRMLEGYQGGGYGTIRGGRR